MVLSVTSLLIGEIRAACRMRIVRQSLFFLLAVDSCRYTVHPNLSPAWTPRHLQAFYIVHSPVCGTVLERQLTEEPMLSRLPSSGIRTEGTRIA